MTGTPHATCARTDAVLALHLDGCGELASVGHEPSPAERERLGYGFVAIDALHQHLHSCRICERALLRARRLDAMLAGDSGRLLAEVAGSDDAARNAWQERMLQRALAAACAETHAAETTSRPLRQRVPAGPEQPSSLGTLVALGSVLFACLASWWCLGARPDAAVARMDTVAATTGPDATADAQQTDPQQADPQQADLQTDLQRADAQGMAETVGSERAAERTPQASAASELPLALVSHLRDHQSRELPHQRTVAASELGARVADPDVAAAPRIAALQRLVQRSGSHSAAGRLACDELLLSLASCGDRVPRIGLGDGIGGERLLHGELLERLRTARPLLQGLQFRIHALASTADERQLTRLDHAACIVASRIGDDRLDTAVRRALRRHPGLAQVVAGALRCGVRGADAAELLLDCWHDQVALGRQHDTLAAAESWFAGQDPLVFRGVEARLDASHATAERVRCLFALGCAADGSTLPPLLAGIERAHRTEAAAAAMALARLPHRVLAGLLPRARRSGDGWLRAALVRSELPATRSWGQRIGLSPAQRDLVRHATLQRFAEVTSWFRDHRLLAE